MNQALNKQSIDMQDQHYADMAKLSTAEGILPMFMQIAECTYTRDILHKMHTWCTTSHRHQSCMPVLDCNQDACKTNQCIILGVHAQTQPEI